ncbi:hypothetical protein [Hoeflea sp.]
MIKRKQLFRHKPDEGVYGDCARTVIACLLDIEPEEVPHHHRHLADGEQQRLHNEWLAQKGFARVTVAYHLERLEEVLAVGKQLSGDMPYILAGTSRTGVNHVVICRHDAIVWDPSRTDAGIIGPCDDGYFFIEWIFRPISSEIVEDAP